MLIIIAILLFIIVLQLAGAMPLFLWLLLHAFLCCVFAGLGLAAFFILSEIDGGKLAHSGPWVAICFALLGPILFYGWLSERR